jgi:hypothetical protein
LEPGFAPPNENLTSAFQALSRTESTLCGRAALVVARDATGLGSAYTRSFFLNAGAGNILQFSLATGCNGNSQITLFDIAVEYTITGGASWVLVPTQSCQTSPACSGWAENEALLDSEAFAFGFRRVVLPLPSFQQTTQITFRFRASASSVNSWGVRDIYAGNACGPSPCGGFGFCSASGNCTCDPGFAQLSTDPTVCVADGTQARDFRETFNDDIPLGQFQLLVGASQIVDVGCGAVSDGKALRFGEAGSRRVVTTDLNTLEASFASFRVRLGSTSTAACGAPTSSDDFYFGFSTNGGLSFTTLRRLTGTSFRTPGVVVANLPAAAKRAGTRFMWFQRTDGILNQAIWQLDDIFIGYNSSTPVSTLLDAFDTFPAPSEWLFTPFSLTGSFCGRNNTLVISSPTAELVTRDLQLQPPSVEVISTANADLTFSFQGGVKASSPCGASGSGWIFNSDTIAGFRELRTRVLDTRAGGLGLQFTFAFGTGDCGGPTMQRNDSTDV